MAEQDDASKTEDPSGKKLADARKKGQTAISTEIKNWFMLLGAAFGLSIMAPSIMLQVRVAATPFIEAPHAIPMDFEHLRTMLADKLIEVAFILAPLAGVLVFLAFAASLLQTGPMYAPKKIHPELSKISLIGGIKKKFSMQSIIEFLKGILKIVIVSVVAFGLTVPLLEDITLIPAMEMVQTLDRLHAVAVRLLAGTVAVMTVIALLDFAWQKYSFTKSMRMTKQEVKDEHKQSEGDPQVKARIRRLRQERAQRRMMAAVPDADVVVTNPTHYAVALEYKMDRMPAPKLVAKGVDHIAKRIREIAEENDVAVVENPPLARALFAAVELDEEVPPEHYKAVAEVIGYVMRLRGELPAA
jgi:flagellar biosynthesis protein FlhB